MFIAYFVLSDYSQQLADLAKSQLDTANTVINYSVYLTGGILLLFSVLGAVFSFIYKNRFRRLIRQLEGQVILAEKKISGYEIKFRELLDSLKNQHVIEIELSRHRAVLGDISLGAEDVFPSIDFVGERGTNGDIELILKACRRFTDDSELSQHGHDAVNKIVNRHMES